MDAAAILTAASVLLTAVVAGVLAIIREVRGVHKIVNQQRTDMTKEIRALRKMVRRRGGDPADAEDAT